MNDKDPRYAEYRRKCAELEGWRYQTNERSGWNGFVHDDQMVFDKGTPTYLDDASIDRVVRVLSNDSMAKYAYYLSLIVNPNEELCAVEIQHARLRATPEQKADALCRTLIGESK